MLSRSCFSVIVDRISMNESEMHLMWQLSFFCLLYNATTMAIQHKTQPTSTILRFMSCLTCSIVRLCVDVWLCTRTHTIFDCHWTNCAYVNESWKQKTFQNNKKIASFLNFFTHYWMIIVKESQFRLL